MLLIVKVWSISACWFICVTTPPKVFWILVIVHSRGGNEFKELLSAPFSPVNVNKLLVSCLSVLTTAAAGDIVKLGSTFWGPLAINSKFKVAIPETFVTTFK